MRPEGQGVYEGRKGQKRLRAIERQIVSVREEFDNRYADSPEMKYLSSTDTYNGVGTAGLIFIMAQRDVNFKWNGLMDYGFIRLCKRWLEEHGLQSVTSEETADMMRDILPEGNVLGAERRAGCAGNRVTAPSLGGCHEI